MPGPIWIIGGLFVVIACLGVLWAKDIGRRMAAVAASCRMIWITPLILSIFPKTKMQDVPGAMNARTIHIFVDDSQSMNISVNGNRRSESGEKASALISELCVKAGCVVREKRLSEIPIMQADGYSFISYALDQWLPGTGSDPWVILSDGGDAQPNLPWNPRLKGQGLGSESRTRGLIISFPPDEEENVWIEYAKTPPFSFEGKPISIDVGLNRSSRRLGVTAVQVQAAVDNEIVGTVNTNFPEGQSETGTTLVIPEISRGQHLLRIQVLPVENERAIWDNEASASIEVLPNTVGVLHLLGSPSWDGRFLRRYLRGEPKYDLISFFILRDPWDSQNVNERELSLIPFPVQRLFADELPNFRVLVIQNFTLVQFLLPEYQKNLVQFVQNGGGLLFLGGPRALKLSDLSNSPLSAILPFDTPKNLGGSPVLDPNGSEAKVGPYYDGEQSFLVKFADPDPTSRALANVYDDWEALRPAIEGFKGLRGLHRLDQVKMKNTEHTVLMHAEVENGKRFPLAVASYPGKGRALWLFSDSFWRLGMSGDVASMQVYHKFLQSSLVWLLRQDLRQPLLIKGLHLFWTDRQSLNWRANVLGPALKYFEPGKDWQISLCGQVYSSEQLTFLRTGTESGFLEGKVADVGESRTSCQLEIAGNHNAFGSVSARATAPIPQIYSDSEISDGLLKISRLSELTGAKVISAASDRLHSELEGWMSEALNRDALIPQPARSKAVRDYYWAFDGVFFWLALVFLFLEVAIRRWKFLTGRLS